MKKMILGVVLVCFSLAVAAEQITPTIGEQTRSSELSLPGRSMTKKAVQGACGDPSEIQDPLVGKPPITAWDYESFTAYFEQSWGLHIVIQHPQNN